MTRGRCWGEMTGGEIGLARYRASGAWNVEDLGLSMRGRPRLMALNDFFEPDIFGNLLR